MKSNSIFLFLATVALFAGCDSAVEVSNLDKDKIETAVQSIETPGQTEPDMIKPDEPKSDAPKQDMTKQDTAKSDAAPSGSSEIEFGDKFPEVLEVKASAGQGDKWRFNVTLSSTYDTPQRYADAWRVLDDQDNELGIRILGHDHANEQPFTRSGTIEIPQGTQKVFVEGRDQANGWSGQRFEFKMP